ncbi:signal transduction histidine kinase [Nocardioides zeae]|uniref:Signal transduction histidine kinase n=1 Tax=Nocardioides zeae TaxID=1457234 RepID=A0ACC6INI4_9ACTN|nr:HAMP domain-containing sensor histidine kinase [Nocardioides zeae]MDR6174424.1 signal transduction histidine kinase [Nocardioides zeae]MDR6212145.1 signal transduction histidine kinase [Nocardioides zeae]
MRLRVAVPLLVAVVVALGLLLTPLMESIAERRTSEIEQERREAVLRTADLARAAIEDGDTVPLQRYLDRYHALFGEDVVVLDDSARVLASVGDLDPGAEEVLQRVRDFGTNLAQLDVPLVTPWSADRVLLSTPVVIEQDLAGGVVVTEVDLRRSQRAVLEGWLVLLVPVSLGLVALAAAAVWTTGWIVRPVHRLDRATHALTSGAPVDDLTLSGPPELRRLATSFQLMATTLATTVEQQRDLVASTSHQLRNPLAAVRLHVDLLAGDGTADPGVVAAVQRDLDRLDTTVDRLLGLAEAEHRINERRAALALREGGPPVGGTSDGAALETHLAERWAPTGAAVTATVAPDVVLAVTVHDLVEMVDTAIENAVKYAGDAPRIHVSLAPAATSVAGEEPGGRAVVTVEDDGAGLTDDELVRVGERFWRSSRHADRPGTGLGLALVDALARANGGTMTVRRSAAGGLAVELDLPRAEGRR